MEIEAGAKDRRIHAHPESGVKFFHPSLLKPIYSTPDPVSLTSFPLCPPGHQHLQSHRFPTSSDSFPRHPQRWLNSGARMPALRLKGDGWEEKDFLSLSSNVGLVYKNNSERLSDQEEKKKDGCSQQRLPPFPPSRDETLVSQRGNSLSDYFVQGFLFLMR